MPTAKIIIIPEGVTTIGDTSFGNYNCTSRDLIDLPSTLKSVIYFGFYAPKILICRAVTPPSASNSYNYLWASGNSNTALYVPDGSVDAYKAHAKWSKMGTGGTSIVNRIKPLSEYTG